MEFLGFLFECFFLGIGIYFYLLLSGRLTFKGSAEQNLTLFKQNAGLLKPLSLVLAFFAAVSLVLHLIQFFKK
jgi:hypothetical protein